MTLVPVRIAPVAMFVLIAACAATAAADEQKTHEGTVVSAGGGKLVMVGEGNQEKSYDIDADAAVTVNGHLGKLEDLQKGMRIRVTTDAAGKVVAVSTVDEAKNVQPFLDRDFLDRAELAR